MAEVDGQPVPGHTASVRLNVAIASAKHPNPLGLIGGDGAGFPNGRRVADDVVTIELRAIAGATFPLVDKTYVPDAAAGIITDGLTAADVPSGPLGCIAMAWWRVSGLAGSRVRPRCCGRCWTAA